MHNEPCYTQYPPSKPFPVSVLVGALIAWFGWIDPILREAHGKPALNLSNLFSQRAGIEQPVESAYKRLEFPEHPERGVTVYRYRDHPIYITGGEETRQCLHRIYAQAEQYTHTYGGKTYMLGDRELEVPGPIKLQDFLDQYQYGSSEGAKKYNEAYQAWARDTHHEQASLIGAVHYGIIEGSTRGTPLTKETAQKMECNLRSLLEQAISDIHRYGYSPGSCTETPAKRPPPRVYGDWLGRGPRQANQEPYSRQTMFSPRGF